MEYGTKPSLKQGPFFEGPSYHAIVHQQKAYTGLGYGTKRIQYVMCLGGRGGGGGGCSLVACLRLDSMQVLGRGVFFVF